MALQLTWHSTLLPRSASILELNLGASADVRGLCHAAEHSVRFERSAFAGIKI